MFVFKMLIPLLMSVFLLNELSAFSAVVTKRPLPNGCLARLGTKSFTAFGPITKLAVSPDGSRIAGVVGTTIIVWNTANGTTHCRLKVGQAAVRANYMSFSANNLKLFVGCRGHSRNPMICIWDLQTGRVLSREYRKDFDLLNMMLEKNGKVKALRVRDHAIETWEVESGRSLKRWHAFKKYVDKWKRRGSEVVRLNTAYSHIINQIATFFEVNSPSKQPSYRLLICDFQSKTIKLSRQFDFPCSDVAFSSDGKLLAIALPKHIRLFQTGESKEIAQIKNVTPGNNLLQFSIDGNWLAIRDRDSGETSVWDIRLAKEINKSPFGKVRSVLFMPDNKTLLVGGDGAIRFWSFVKDSETRFGKEHRDVPYYVRFDENEMFVDDGEKISTWNVNNFARKTVVKNPWQLMESTLAICYTKNMFLCVSNKGRLHLCKFNNARVVRDYGISIDQKSHLPSRIRFSPKGSLFLLPRSRDLLEIIETDSGRRLCCIRGDFYNLYDPQFSGDEKHLFLQIEKGLPGRFAVFDVSSGKIVRQLGKRSSSGGDWPSLISVAVNENLLATVPDGKSYTGSIVSIWDVNSGAEIRRLNLSRISKRIRDIDWSADNRLIAIVCNYDPHIRLIEVATGRERGKYFAGGEIAQCSFSPNTMKLATSLLDTTVLIWDLHRSINAKTKIASTMTKKQLFLCWQMLGTIDAQAADIAMWQMIRAEEQTIPFLKRRIRPIWRRSPDEMDKLVRALSNSKFSIRQKATLELEKLEKLAVPSLRNHLRKTIPLETRTRIKEILKKTEYPLNLNSEANRRTRLVEILERIGSPDSIELLKEIAKGAPEISFTKEAVASLKRLAAVFKD